MVRLKVFAVLAAASVLVCGRAYGQVIWNPDVGSGNISSGGSWVGGIAPANDGTADLEFDSEETTGMTVDTAYSIDSLTVDPGQTGPVNVGGSTLTIGSYVINNSSYGLTFCAPLVLGSEFTFSGASGSSITLMGGVSGSNGYLVQDGINLLVEGSHTVTGTLDVESGASLQFDFTANNTVLSNAITNNSWVTFGGNSENAMVYTGVMTGTGVVEISQAVTFSGNNLYSGFTRIDGGSSLTDSAAYAFSPNSDVYMESNSTLNVNYAEQIGNLSDTPDGSTAINLNGSLASLTVTNTTSNTYAGVISGSGSLTVGGSCGTSLTLTNTNTYTGGTTIDSMVTLQLGDGDSTGSIAGNVVDNGTLTFDNPNCTTFSGAVSGNGQVLIEDGMVTLMGVNTYYGTTTVDGAKLEDGAANTYSPYSLVSLEDSAKLDVKYAETVNGLSGDSTSSVCISEGAKLITTGSGGVTFSGAISGAGSLEVGTGGYEVLNGSNTYSGNTKIDCNATLQLGDGESTGSIETNVTDKGTLVFDNPDCFTFSTSICGSGNVNVVYGMVTLSGSNTYSGTTSVNGAKLYDGATDAFSASSSIEVENSGKVSVGYNEAIAGLSGDSSGQVCISSESTLLTNGSNCTFAGVISGSGSLEIGNGGLQILTGDNTYSGGTTIDCNATLQLGDGYNDGSITGNVVDNGVFAFANPDCLNFSGNICGNGSVTILGGMVTLSGSNSYSGGTSLTDGSEVKVTSSNSLGTGTVTSEATNTAPTIAPSGGNVCLSNNIMVAAAGLNLNEQGNCNTLMLSGVISNLSSFDSLTINGDVVLSGVNTYSGGTTLNNGTLTVTNSASLGTGPLIVNDNDIPALVPSGGDVTIPNAIWLPVEGLALNTSGSTNTLILTGSITDNGVEAGELVINGPVTLSGTNSYTGGTTINNVSNADGVTIESDTGLGTGSVTATGSILNFTSNSPIVNGLSLDNTTVNFTGTNPELVNMQSDTLTSGNALTVGSGTTLAIKDTGTYETDFYGTLSGLGGIEKKGSGELDLYGTNGYAGGTTISGGLLVAHSGGSLGSGAVVINGSNSVLGVGPGVTVTNPVTLTEGAIGGYGTINPSSATTFNFSAGNAVSGGAGPFGTGGAGLTDQGALNFGANTTVVFGTGGVYDFAIENSGVGTTAGVDYSTLNLNGAFNLTASSFTINLLSVNSSGSLGTATFNPFMAYQWTLLTTAAPITGFSASDFTIDASLFNSGAYSGGNFYVTEGAGNTSLVLNFTPVPEPSTWVMMVGGILSLGAAVRRRSRR